MSAPFERQVATDAPKPKRAVLYLRVSTEEQADTDYNTEGYSLPAQREACVRLSDQLGATVVGEYVDRGESAKSAKRPELQRMLKRLQEQADVDYVIVHKVDRLARNRKDDVEIDLVIRSSGARLVSASENIDDTPHGKLIRNIMADQLAVRGVVDVFAGRHQPCPAGPDHQVYFHVVFPVASQSVDLVDDDVIHVSLFLEPLKHPLQFRPLG